MAFTSPSVANKNNTFHIVGAKYHLIVYVKELINFSLLQQVSMLVPTYSDGHHLVTPELIPTSIECINVKRVIDTCLKEHEYKIKIKVNREPKRILTCSIIDVKVNVESTPCKDRKYSFALGMLSYGILIKYIDAFGKVISIIYKVQSCVQWSHEKDKTAYLDIKAKVDCLYSKVCRNSTVLHQTIRKKSFHL
ncbi:hypothetical protein [Alkaliphilus transvaalensis]|uniref:hypothetical protein n=1 Tax=Alkaliphilus transvaalensis TaxID=114628 RepID=UPI00047B3133|nr:hypothetical protein [Alkaliphilus transvaalensis]